MAIVTNPTYDQSTVTTTTRALYTTIRDHFRDEEVEILRRFKVWRMLDEAGRIHMGASGAGFDWPVRYRIHEVQDTTGADPRNFVAQDLWKLANLDYRGYQVTDAISKREDLENKGREGIIKVASGMVERLKESLNEVMPREMYTDGMASGNSRKLCGFDTFTGVKQAAGVDQSINITTTGSSLNFQNVAAADPVMWPDDSYAGLSTDLGDYGGAQVSGTWPDGIADPHFDFWSPVLVNSNSSFFGASPQWATYARDILSFGIIHSQRNAPSEGNMDMVVCDRTLYTQARNILTDAERIIVTNKTGLRSFGFRDIFEIDGVEVTWEYGVPYTNAYRTSTATPVPAAYGFSIGNMDLYSLQSSLFKVEGPEYDIDSAHTKVVVDFLGNLKFKSPRRFTKWAAYSATS
jgi:hypothetical protein